MLTRSAGNKNASAATSGLALLSIEDQILITNYAKTVPVVYSAAHVVRGVRIGYVQASTKRWRSARRWAWRQNAGRVGDIQKRRICQLLTRILSTIAAMQPIRNWSRANSSLFDYWGRRVAP